MFNWKLIRTVLLLAALAGLGWLIRLDHYQRQCQAAAWESIQNHRDISSQGQRACHEAGRDE
jgi:hypothetical protein